MTTTKTTARNRLKKKLTTTLTLTAATTALLTSCYPNPAIFLGADEASRVNSVSLKCNNSSSAPEPTSTPTEAEFTLEKKSVATIDPNAIEVPGHLVPLIEQASQETGIPTSIITAQLYQESKFDSNAVSWVGARGIAQFMPDTWAAIYPQGDPTNDEDAMKAYAILMNQYREIVRPLAGDNDTQLMRLTLAAYNAGPGNVLAHGGVPSIPETVHYVEKILGDQQVFFSNGTSDGNCSRSGGTAWDGDLGTGEWTNPCPGCVLTSGYGWRDLGPGYPDWMDEHVGVDMASVSAGPAATIVSPTDLTIVNIDPNFGCVTGQMPEAKLQLNFCHLDSWKVSVGDSIARGDIIGVEGGRGPGNATAFARHLHFEIFRPESPVPAWPYNGFNIDPMPILREKGAAPA